MNEKNDIDDFADALAKSNAKLTFGLQPHHLERIESERKRWNGIKIVSMETQPPDVIYSVHFWGQLGKEFSWHPLTLALYYFGYLSEARAKEVSEQMPALIRQAEERGAREFIKHLCGDPKLKCDPMNYILSIEEEYIENL